MMGRKRINHMDKRVGISISIPKRLLLDFDDLLKADEERSAYIERFIQHWVQTVKRARNQSLDEWMPEPKSWVYYCETCEQAWESKTNKGSTAPCANRQHRLNGGEMSFIEERFDELDTMIKLSTSRGEEE